MWSVVWKISTPHSTFSTTSTTAHNGYTITNQQFIILYNIMAYNLYYYR